MASPLTITSTASATTGKGPTGFVSQVGDVGADVFASLLGTAGKAIEATASAASDSTMDLGIGNLMNLSFGFDDDRATESDDPEAVAAVVNAIVPFHDTIDAIPALTDIVDDLAELKARLAAGEPIDPEALKRIDAALANLGDALGIDLETLPAPGDLASLVTDLAPDDSSFEARLAVALAPVVDALAVGDAAATTNPQLPDLMKSVSDKLAAMLVALNNGDVPTEQLAALDVAVEVDPDLEAALTKLANPALKIEMAAATTVLAAPELKLTEPVLTGKADPDASTAKADDATQTPDAVAPAQGDTKDGATRDKDSAPAAIASTDDRKPDDTKPGDTRITATPQATTTAPTDQPDGTAAAPTVQAARADVAPAPRVVQAGYQTSQQQLNLPQLAFELVRQVSDGNTRFQMRLDPAELGKIDVRLDIDSTGQINARLTVEKAETLDLMQRDQKALERALQQAGLDGAKTNLEFSLKQNPFGGGQQGQDGNGRQSLFGNQSTGDADEAPPPTVNLYRGSLSASGVNIIA